MRDDGWVLANGFEGPGGCGAAAPEAKALVDLGRRLRDECPNADPAFLHRLGHTVQEEWARVAPPARGRRAVWRWARAAAATLAVVVLLAVGALLLPGTHVPAEAGLGRVITAFKHARVEIAPLQTATPPPWRGERYPGLEEAQSAVGFRVRVPSYLPDGLALDQVTATEHGGVRRVSLQYSGTTETLAQTTLSIHESVATAATEAQPWTIETGGDDIRSLQVAGRPALWVQGHWTRAGRWAAGGDQGMLLVQDGDVLIQIVGRFSQEECVRIAESMLR